MVTNQYFAHLGTSILLLSSLFSDRIDLELVPNTFPVKIYPFLSKLTSIEANGYLVFIAR